MSKINFVYEYLYLGACLNYRLYQITTPDYIILQVCFFPPKNLIQGINLIIWLFMHFERQETHHAMIGNNGNYIIYIRICDLEILELLLFMGLAFCLFHNQFEFFDRKPLFHRYRFIFWWLPGEHVSRGRGGLSNPILEASSNEALFLKTRIVLLIPQASKIRNQ